MLLKGFEVFPIIDIDSLCYMDAGERAKASPKQRSYIHGLMTKASVSENDLILSMGRRYGIKQFSIRDASEAIEYLKTVAYGGVQ